MRDAVIQPDEVVARGGDAALDALMLRLLPDAASFARAPVSAFRVGAIARGASGRLYAGANIEVRGAPLGCSVHAEQCAVSNARRHGETRLVALAVSAPPCGHCRQFLCELPDADRLRILCDGTAATTLGALLPAAFTPAALGVRADPLAAAHVPLVLDEDEADRTSAADDALLRAARDAAGTSHAPYSATRAGVALRTAGGAVHRGAALESVAYNPTLPPLQDALAGLLLAGEPFDAIERCALVETSGAVSYRAPSAAVLAALGCSGSLRYARAR
jgi:cytidine deaminase